MFFLLIMIKGIFKTYNTAGTFCYPLAFFVNTILLRMVKLLIVFIWFHHIDTINGVTSLLEPNFISKVTLLNEDYFP